MNVQQQQFAVGSMLRFTQASSVRPTSVEQYEDLLQRQHNTGTPFPARPEQVNTPRPPIHPQQLQQKSPATTTSNIPQVKIRVLEVNNNNNKVYWTSVYKTHIDIKKKVLFMFLFVAGIGKY